MSAVDEILSQIPLAQLAGQLGVDEYTAEQATRQQEQMGLTPVLLVTGGVDLAQVDPGDGDKIVGHVFGANREQVVQKLGSAGGAGIGQDLIAKLLPILAPIVMAWLAQKLTGAGAAAGAPAAPAGTPAGGGIGGVLGGVLGSVLGGSGGSAGAAGGLGDLLGGLLGGGRR